LTGQFIFREAGIHEGKHLMMVVGIVAVPEGAVKGEHQYIVSGTEDLSLVTIHHGTEIDLTKQIRGHSIGQVLTEPIWRV
jgi:hypothetical protein